MTRFLTTVALAVLLTIATLGWLAFREGIFDSPEALDEQAASLDAGVFDQWLFVDGGVEDAGVGDAGVEDAGVGDAGIGDARAHRRAAGDQAGNLRLQQVRTC